jgi:hypothetical protein
MAFRHWKRSSLDIHLEEERKTVKEVIMIELTIQNKNFRYEVYTYAKDAREYLIEKIKNALLHKYYLKEEVCELFSICNYPYSFYFLRFPNSKYFTFFLTYQCKYRAYIL